MRTRGRRELSTRARGIDGAARAGRYARAAHVTRAGHDAHLLRDPRIGRLQPLREQRLVRHLAHEGRIRLPRDLAVHLGAGAAELLGAVEPLRDEGGQRKRGRRLQRTGDRQGEVVQRDARRVGDEEDVAEQTTISRAHANEQPMSQECEAPIVRLNVKHRRALTLIAAPAEHFVVSRFCPLHFGGDFRRVITLCCRLK